MQRFQVPQFITVEDRIIGPLTVKQFLYLLGAAAAIILGWVFLHFVLFFLAALPAAALFAALAFVKVNGRPLPVVLFAAINYYLKPRIYLWRPTPPPSRAPPVLPSATPEPSPFPLNPKLTARKLDELAWSLDIQEHTRT